MEELSNATRSVFHGMEAEQLTVRVGPVTVARDLLTSAPGRSGVFQPFIDRDSVVSHTTAAWIHWGIGSPFPLTVCSPRRRKNDGLIRYYDKRAHQHLDTSLPIAVTTAALTIVQLFEIGVLADSEDRMSQSHHALHAYGVPHRADGTGPNLTPLKPSSVPLRIRGQFDDTTHTIIGTVQSSIS